MVLPFWEPDDDELAAHETAEAINPEEATATRKLGLPFMPTLKPKAAVAYQVLQDLFEQTAPACKGIETDLFFPERGASTKEAKAICRACFARSECLEYALEGSEKFGIWGGTSERERRRLRRERSAKEKQRAYEVKALSESIDSFGAPIVVLPLAQQQTYPTPVPSPSATGDELSKDEVDWFKKLTSDKSLSKAIYASYKSGTHLAQSDQPKPLRYNGKPIRPCRATEPKPIVQAVRRYPDKATKTETRMYADTSSEQRSVLGDATLAKICAVLDQMGGRIHNEKGFATRELREHGLDYSSLNTDLQMAEEADLIWRDMSTTRTYEIKLTEQGRQLASKQAGVTSEEVEKPESELQEKDSQRDVSSEDLDTLDQIEEIRGRVLVTARELQLTKQRCTELEVRCSALSDENSHLKQILSSFSDKLQEALAVSNQATQP